MVKPLLGFFAEFLSEFCFDGVGEGGVADFVFCDVGEVPAEERVGGVAALVHGLGSRVGFVDAAFDGVFDENALEVAAGQGAPGNVGFDAKAEMRSDGQKGFDVAAFVVCGVGGGIDECLAGAVVGEFPGEAFEGDHGFGFFVGCALQVGT